MLSLHWQQADAPSQDLGFLDHTAAVSHKTGAWVAAHGGGGDTEAQPVPFSPCGLIIFLDLAPLFPELLEFYPRC